MTEPKTVHKRLALIRARKGSVGLPDKNMRPLGGKPLVQWTIEAAIQSRVFDSGVIAVSTNWPELATLAGDLGVQPVPRPESLSGGFATIESVIDHTMGWLQANKGHDPASWTQIVLLNPTSPLRSAEDIRATTDAIERTKRFTNSMSVMEHNWIEMTNCRNGKRGIEGAWRVSVEAHPNRQRRRPNVIQNGAVYVIDGNFYREFHKWLGPRSGVHVMPKERSVDIDDIWDFMVAETYYQESLRQKGLA